LVEGSRIVSYDPARPADGVTNLTSDFTAAGRADVSFDGQRVLFVGRRTKGVPLGVWEMNVDGSGLRQIIGQARDCTEAIYLSTIYTLGAEEPVYQIAFCTAAQGEGVGSLYTCHLDGTHVRRITFNPYGATGPFLLSDGRLLYSSWTRPGLEGSHGSGSVLFTVNTDGTDVFPFAGTHQDAAVRGMPCEMPDGRVVYVEAAMESSDGGGSLVAVSRKRSLHTRRVVAAGGDWLHHSPAASADGRLLVSCRRGAGESYGIHALDLQTGARMATVFDSPQWHEVDAAPVRERPVPAGRSSVVKDGVDHGFLYCLDAYLSDTARSKDIRRGQVKQIRIVKAVLDDNGGVTDAPAPGGSSSGPPKEEVLGEALVEDDGSFYLRLPARTPFRLETLGEGGEVLQAMESWIWVMPKEGRGCIGCHADRELTPPNRFVQAVRKEPQEVGRARQQRPKTSPGNYPRTPYRGEQRK
jgi:Tol biopolymer transport system component